MSYRIGVDIGGTFTDFCAFNDQTNELHTLKVLSTPATPGKEVMEGIDLLQARYGVQPSEVNYFTHGTTVGINTVIQRKGVRLCLITTDNFRDVLELQRLKMPDPYSLYSVRADPLIPRDRVLTVRERILTDGTVDTPLDEDAVQAAVQEARRLETKGIIISFINAYRNPAHEQQAKALIGKLAPELFVFCSHEIWPVIREFERTITTVINGYVQPPVSFYLTSLEKALVEKGVPAAPLITKSNGGVMSVESGKTATVQILLSGTASGVMGASYVTQMAGFPNVVSLDIGGTSADVALVKDGQPQYGTGERIGEFALHIPSVSVTSIGDGGGSIAWVDEFGVLKVGPESAGSDPGPACYGHGGTRPTITDAFVVCGFLGQAQLAYDSISMHTDLAEQAVGELAARLGMGLVETAEAIIKVSVSGMYTELSKLFAKYGADPRDFAMLAFGGAGPMIASFLVRELGMTHLIIPTAPGVLSALGGLISDLKNDFIRTVYLQLEDGAAATMQEGFAGLRQQALAWLHEEQGYSGPERIVYSGDMRYEGQSFEIEVPFEEAWVHGGNLAAIEEAFHAQHKRVYEYSDPAAVVQLINLRMVVVGTNPKPTFPKLDERPGTPAPLKQLEAYFDGIKHAVPLYRRSDFKPGNTFQGPAVIVQDDTTSCVLDGYRGKVDAYGNIILHSGF
jgi:N-methylhydantoinase A